MLTLCVLWNSPWQFDKAKIFSINHSTSWSSEMVRKSSWPSCIQFRQHLRLFLKFQRNQRCESTRQFLSHFRWFLCKTSAPIQMTKRRGDKEQLCYFHSQLRSRLLEMKLNLFMFTVTEDQSTSDFLWSVHWTTSHNDTCTFIRHKPCSCFPNSTVCACHDDRLAT